MSATLELATTEELIEELTHRSTFAGLVLYSDEEHRVDPQTHANFTLVSSLDRPGVISLLEIANEQIKEEN